MKKVTILVTLVLMLMIGVSISVQAQASQTYIIVANGGVLPTDLAAQVAAANGTLDVVYSEFGVAVATSSNSRFKNRIQGVQAVVQDIGFDVQYPAIQTESITFDQITSTGGNSGNGNGKGGKKNNTSANSSASVEATGYPPNSGDDDFFFDMQWGHNYVGAQEAWAAGLTGAGVRVAVLDGGFDLDHPDLAPNINYALSADMTGEGLQYTLPDTFSHGTHTSGTIGAADNGFGTIGVAPDVDLVLVKVLGDAGSGSFADVIAGIYYAAIVDADVISMSLGAVIPRGSNPASGNLPGDSAEISALANAVQAAITFAYQNGSTVVVSGGNDGADLDGDGSNVRFQTGMAHTIGVSALTTLNWAGNPIQDLVPASYTNYGTSMIDFGAPGGSVDYPGNESCTVAGRTRPCWVFDLVFSTGNNGWYWSAGTSMAAPHVAGVAALIIQANGGDMAPAQVEAALRARAVDGGAPGVDDFFGHGIANTGF